MDAAPHTTTTTNNNKRVNKNTDAKGRVTLGTRFANRTVIIQEVSDTELLVQLARVIPENELAFRASRRLVVAPTASD